MAHNTSNKLKHLQGKTNQHSVENFFNINKGIFCIKLDLANGFIYNTSNGQFRTTETDTKPYTFDECIADGRDAIFVVWNNSYEAKTENHVYHYHNSDGTITDTTNNDCLNIKFKVGAYAYGFNTEYVDSVDIGDEPSYNDFTSIKNNPSFTLTFSKKQFHNNFNFKDNERSLYAFPDETGFKLYTANVTRKFKFGKYTEIVNGDANKDTEVVIEVEFTHISNKFQKSGKAIEEYVFLSCFGGFFAWPEVDLDDDGNKTVKINKKLLCVGNNTLDGVTYIQEEFYNACIQSATCYEGWEIVSSINGGPGTISQPVEVVGEDDTYEVNLWSPKKLFPVKYQTATPKIINKSLTPVNNFVLLSEINFTFDRYADWKAMKQQQLTQDFDDKYKGEFNWNSNLETYDNISELNIPKTVSKDKILSDWFATGFIDTTKAEIDTLNMRWCDFNMFNFFNDVDILSLPFQFTQHVSHLLKDTPYIGGIINLITGGIPLNWGNTLITTGAPGSYSISKKINGLIPLQFLDMCRKDWSSETATSGYLHYFTDKNGDKLAANNMNTTYLYQLSDVVDFSLPYNSSAPIIEINTAYLGTDWAPSSTDDFQNLYPFYGYEPVNNSYAIDELKNDIFTGISTLSFSDDFEVVIPWDVGNKQVTFNHNTKLEFWCQNVHDDYYVSMTIDGETHYLWSKQLGFWSSHTWTNGTTWNQETKTVYFVDPENNYCLSNEISYTDYTGDCGGITISRMPNINKLTYGYHSVNDNYQKSFILSHYMNYNYGANAVKLSFFDINKKPIGQLSQNTIANFLNNDREWFNVINLNQFNNILVYGNVVNWPNLPNPNPQPEASITIKATEKTTGNGTVNNDNDFPAYDGDAKTPYNGVSYVNDKWVLDSPKTDTQQFEITITYRNENWGASTTSSEAISSLLSDSSNYIALNYSTNIIFRADWHPATVKSWYNKGAESHDTQITDSVSLPFEFNKIIDNGDGTYKYSSISTNLQSDDIKVLVNIGGKGATHYHTYTGTFNYQYYANNLDITITFEGEGTDAAYVKVVINNFNLNYDYNFFNTEGEKIWLYDEVQTIWPSYSHTRNCYTINPITFMNVSISN